LPSSQRYKRNQITISSSQQEILAQKKVLVVGCGGLGGFIIEGLARLGIGTIKAVDYDVFSITNLNRQLYSEEGKLGQKKALAAKRRVAKVNPDIHMEAVCTTFHVGNAKTLVKGMDLAVDAMDNFKGKALLEKTCHELGLPVIHGGIGGDFGQFGVSVPGRPLLKGCEDLDDEFEREMGNPYYTPCIVAGFQVKLAVDVLLENDYMVGGMYFLDLTDFTLAFSEIEPEDRMFPSQDSQLEKKQAL